MAGGMSAACAERVAMQVEGLRWCERLTLHHETKVSAKG